MNTTRRATCDLLEMAEQQPSLWETIARAALNYMSEEEVKDMAETEGLIEEEEEEEEE